MPAYYRRILPIVFALGVAACENAGPLTTTTHDHMGSVEERVVGGTFDAADPAVVMVIMRANATSSDVKIVCTGTIVAPHVVLTAAHCLDPRVAPAGQYGVFTGDDSTDLTEWSDGANFFTAKETHFDPKFDPANPPPNGGHDLGVIIVSSPFTATPLPLNRNALDAAFVGTSVRAIGNGRSLATSDSDGQMNQFTTTITGIDPEHLLLQDPKSSICGGDSGGPLLATIGGREMIVGVHSYGEHSESCTGISYDQRVDAYVETFIAPFIKTADPNFKLIDTTAVPDAGVATVPTGNDNNDAGVVNNAPPATPTAKSDAGGCSIHDGRPSSNQSSLFAAVLALGLIGIKRRRSMI